MYHWRSKFQFRISVAVFEPLFSCRLHSRQVTGYILVLSCRKPNTNITASGDISLLLLSLFTLLATSAHSLNAQHHNRFIMATAPTTQQTQTTSITPASHAPSLAGSVIEASDGLGGSTLIRIQNISCTGKLQSLIHFLTKPPIYTGLMFCTSIFPQQISACD